MTAVIGQAPARRIIGRLQHGEKAGVSVDERAQAILDRARNIVARGLLPPTLEFIRETARRAPDWKDAAISVALVAASVGAALHVDGKLAEAERYALHARLHQLDTDQLSERVGHARRLMAAVGSETPLKIVQEDDAKGTPLDAAATQWPLPACEVTVFSDAGQKGWLKRVEGLAERQRAMIADGVAILSCRRAANGLSVRLDQVVADVAQHYVSLGAITKAQQGAIESAALDEVYRVYEVERPAATEHEQMR